MAKKILLFVIILIIILAGAGGYVIYAKDSPVFDIFFSQDQKDERVLNRMGKLFPDTIGEFVLYSRGPVKMQKIRNDCDDVNETINGENFQGVLCKIGIRAEYRNKNNMSIFVIFHKFQSGKELLMKILDKIAQKDTLFGYNVLRVENHEISWFLNNKPDIDYIVLQEALVEKRPDGGENMISSSEAIGKNSVMQYFVTKYPPAK